MLYCHCFICNHIHVMVFIIFAKTKNRQDYENKTTDSRSQGRAGSV